MYFSLWSFLLSWVKKKTFSLFYFLERPRHEIAARLPSRSGSHRQLKYDPPRTVSTSNADCERANQNETAKGDEVNGREREREIKFSSN